jgi:cytochrome P450
MSKSATTQQVSEQRSEIPPQPPHSDPAIHDWLRARRNDSPVYFDEMIRAWRVFRYADVARILTDSATYSADVSRVMPQQSFIAGNIAMMDPPMHTRVRSIVSRAFTPKVVAGLEPRVAAITNQLLDTAVAKGDQFDLIEDLSYPMPMMVIADLLGVPQSDLGLFRGWAEGMLSIKVDIQSAEFVQAIERARRQLCDYLLELVAYRRGRPGDDLISGLIAADVDGERLDGEVVANFSGLLLMAGHVTTTLVLSNTMLCLEENADARAEVLADRNKLPRLIEEVLRYRPAFVINLRVTNRDVVLHGQTIPASSLVFSSLWSANHDERQFADPGRFDIHRDPNPHLGFGQGIHYCIGAPLGRLETRVALDILLTRFPGIAMTPGTSPEFYESGLCGVRSLQMTFNRG